MAVAKSYASYPILGEPFEENKRMYVNVQAPKGPKKVRWYTDKEYNKMYPDTPIVQNSMDFNAYHAFGFDGAGYITIYKGAKVEEWAENDRTNIWYNLTFGYFTPSKFVLPRLIDGIRAIRLDWNDVQDHDNVMKPHTEVQKIVKRL